MPIQLLEVAMLKAIMKITEKVYTFFFKFGKICYFLL